MRPGICLLGVGSFELLFGSAGDHLLLAGTKVKSGLIGGHPSLTGLDQGDLRHHTDFRQVYAAVLEQWLKTESTPVLGGSFRPVEAINTDSEAAVVFPGHVPAGH